MLRLHMRRHVGERPTATRADASLGALLEFRDLTFGRDDNVALVRDLVVLLRDPLLEHVPLAAQFVDLRFASYEVLGVPVRAIELELFLALTRYPIDVAVNGELGLAPTASLFNEIEHGRHE